MHPAKARSWNPMTRRARRLQESERRDAGIGMHGVVDGELFPGRVVWHAWSLFAVPRRDAASGWEELDTPEFVSFLWSTGCDLLLRHEAYATAVPALRLFDYAAARAGEHIACRARLGWPRHRGRYC
jgi:hypothetical protein